MGDGCVYCVCVCVCEREREEGILLSLCLFKKVLGHHRGRGSLRSISVLDRLLLTVPVWLQLSINPATALHILQREPPGTFLVRKSRTSQKNVLCVHIYGLTCSLQRNLWMASLPTVWILLRSNVILQSGLPSCPVASSRLTRPSPASRRTRRMTKRACMCA
uniref:SH2 domain-containing protein n=1 Tax=Cynoglossus semilaevis TaxID=244447 RepID=A0A3P8WVJ6_CYNSE